LKDISMFGKVRGAVRVACTGQIETASILGRQWKKKSVAGLKHRRNRL